MGGLMAADETVATTLARETWEEAGLRMADLRELTAGGILTMRRPVGNGYMVEHIHVHEAMVPAGLVPVNQDGEVAAFERLSLDALHERLSAGVFTLEAALILARALALRKRG
jgi:8-oxo-dGTP pyrophosphatase MutT (NUDIX family)